MEKYTKISAYAVFIFVGLFAIVVGTRIDQQTISLLAGTVMGFLVASVTVGSFAYVLGRRRPDIREQSQQMRYISAVPQPQQMYTMPPYIQQFQAHMGSANQYNAMLMQQSAPITQTMQLPQPRRFYTIGTAGASEEMTDLYEQGDRTGY